MRFILISLIAVTLVITFNNVTNPPIIAESRSEAATEQGQLTAVYLVPPTALGRDELYFSEDGLREYNIQVVGDIEGFTGSSRLVDGLDILYIHPQVLDVVDNNWLTEQYEKGTAIVAVDTLLSDLGKKLGVTAPFPDLDLGYAQGRHYVAYYFSRPNDYGGRYNKVYADFQEDINHVLIAINYTTTEAIGLTRR